MKFPDWYQICSFVSYTSYIKDNVMPQCDRMACHTEMMPKTCECCLPEGRVNIKDLVTDLDTKVFGQHIAKQVILNVMKNEDRVKPLVLSFHGPTGTGKTFISQILAKHFNPRGTESQFMHRIVVSYSFPHTNNVGAYKEQLHAWIRGNVTRCERSIFIFEEADQMHPDLLNSLKPYLDYHDKVDGVSYRKSVFIFISNTGANKIIDLALEFWRQGKKREEIPWFDAHSMLSSYLQNALHSEYHNSDLIKNKVIDVFVPFLPLELKHVKRCVMAELHWQGKPEDEKIADRIAKSMEYYPKGEKFFSENGCKLVHV